MGYYTSYSLQCYGPEKRVKEFEQELLDSHKDSDGEPDCELKELIEEGGIYAKLYDLPEWIAALAKKYPDLLICLSGDGEESDDWWEERWKGEEHEFQKAIIPPFTNENLLIPNNN